MVKAIVLEIASKMTEDLVKYHYDQVHEIEGEMEKKE